MAQASSWRVLHAMAQPCTSLSFATGCAMDDVPCCHLGTNATNEVMALYGPASRRWRCLSVPTPETPTEPSGVATGAPLAVALFLLHDLIPSLTTQVCHCPEVAVLYAHSIRRLTHERWRSAVGYLHWWRQSTLLPSPWQSGVPLAWHAFVRESGEHSQSRCLRS